MAKLKKHSWDMMFTYPLGMLFLYAMFVDFFKDWGFNTEMLGIVWMYCSCLLAFWMVENYNKPVKKNE